MHQMVRPNVIKDALKWLKNNNKLYENVRLNEHWEADWQHEDSELWTAITADTPDAVTVDTTDSQVGDHLPAQHQHNIDESAGDEKEKEDERQLIEDQAAVDRDSMTRGLPFDSCLHINNVEAHTVNIAPAEGQNPLPIFEDKIFEEGCNPEKYPLGRGGFSTQRKVKLTAKKFFNQRVLDVDGRFVRDPQYLHIAQYAVESKNVYDQMMIALRKVKSTQVGGKVITAGLLKTNDSVTQLLKQDQAYKFLKNVRGSPPYWQKVFYDVLAMVRQLGCPTWFMSLSAARVVDTD